MGDAYEEALAALSTLISGRQRPQGSTWEWEHAFEAMQLYLKAGTAGWGSKAKQTLGASRADWWMPICSV